MLSRPWPLGSSKVVLRAVTRSVATSAIAETMLVPAEYARWGALPLTSLRRNTLLMGRIAAKEAVQAWASSTHNLWLDPAQIEILSSATGRPYLQHLSGGAEAVIVPQLSITHTTTSAIAAVAGPGIYPGIDLEVFAEQQWGAQFPALFSSHERALAIRRGQLDFAMLVTLWSSKESAAKALGVGLGRDPGEWKIAHYTEQPGCHHVQQEASAIQAHGKPQTDSRTEVIPSEIQIPSSPDIATYGATTVRYQNQRLYVEFWRTQQWVFTCCLADRLGSDLV